MEENRSNENQRRKESGDGVEMARNERMKKRSKQTKSNGREEMF